MSADTLERVVPLKHIVIGRLEIVGVKVFACAAGDDFLPITLFIGDDEVEETAQVVVLAKEGIGELVRQIDLFEYLLHREGEQDIEQREHSDEEACVLRESRALEFPGNEFAELCAQEGEGEEFGRFVLGEGLEADKRHPTAHTACPEENSRLFQVGNVVGESDSCGVDVGEQLVNEVRIRGDDTGNGGEINILTVDLAEEAHFRERVAREPLLLQNGGLAEEISLKEDVAVCERLLKFLFGFDLFSQQTNVLRQDLAHLFALLGAVRDAEVHLDDVRHVNQRLVARQEDEVVEGDLVARLLELLYGLQNLRRWLHIFQNLDNDGFRRQEFRRAREEVLLRKVDECTLV